MRPAIFVLCALVFSGTFASAEERLPYETFVAHAQALKPGDARAAIVAALGRPEEERATYLRYSLAGLGRMPPPPGTTVYYGAVIPMHDGRMSGAIQWAWMDTTGMVLPPKKGH